MAASLNLVFPVARYTQGTFKAHGLSLACQPPLNLVCWGCKIHSRDIQGLESSKMPWLIPATSWEVHSRSCKELQGKCFRTISLSLVSSSYSVRKRFHMGFPCIRFDHVDCHVTVSNLLWDETIVPNVSGLGTSKWNKRSRLRFQTYDAAFPDVWYGF